MSIGEFAALVGLPLLGTTVAAITVYRQLRNKLKDQEQRLGSQHKKLRDELRETKSRLDGRTSSIPSLLSSMHRLECRQGQLEARLADDVPGLRFVIITLPKVGSVSVVRTLQTAFPTATVEHCHSISLEGQRELSVVIDRMPEGEAREDLCRHLRRSVTLRPELEALTLDPASRERVFFICGTREPLGWALSLLFQMIDSGSAYAECSSVEQAQAIIMEWFTGRPRSHWLPAPADWMSRELSGYLGVDPLAQPFDQRRGYQVMETKRGRLLLYRYENFPQLPHALAELLTAPVSLFPMAQENVGADKNSGPLYRQIAASLRFPRAFVEQVYSEPYATTFYSPEERRGFVDRWSEG